MKKTYVNGALIHYGADVRALETEFVVGDVVWKDDGVTFTTIDGREHTVPVDEFWGIAPFVAFEG